MDYRSKAAASLLSLTVCSIGAAAQEPPVEESIDTAAVVTASQSEKRISGLMAGNLSFDLDRLEGLPGLLGVNDVLKTLQLMPGIQASGEADSGIYIRGGDPGHNLVLLDGAPVYNPSHLMGFFSIFNGEHIDNTTLYKSAVSPEYGGRLGAVIDVSSGSETTDKVTGSFNVGMIASQGTLGIPTGRKSSLYLSGRATYMNYILTAFSKEGKVTPRYGFKDGNLTWIYRPDSSNRLKFSMYYGTDDARFSYLSFQATGKLKWSNGTASLSWESEPDENIKMKHTAFFTMNDNDLGIKHTGASLQLPSHVMDIGYRGDISVSLPVGKLAAGIYCTHHDIMVQHPVVENLYGMNSDKGPRYSTHEFGAYAGYSANITPFITFDAGLRYSFSLQSPGNGKFPLYNGAEPRVSLSFDVGPNMRIITAYSLQRQYVNQVSVSGMGLPTDFWIPAVAGIKPQASHSVSAGFFHSFRQGMFEYSAEIYYKELYRLLEFDGGMFEMVNDKYVLEDHVLSGSGRNYGAEFMFKKNKGTVTGWLSYTLSWARRSFPGIMDGKTFPSKHDRRHNLAAVVTYKPHRQLDLSAVFIYATGTAFTMPASLYIIGESVLSVYGPRNSGRMPDYHRLDLSATWHLKRKGQCRHSFNLSLYNAYARNNPVFLDIRVKYKEGDDAVGLSAKGVSFYTIIPSIGYILKF